MTAEPQTEPLRALTVSPEWGHGIAHLGKPIEIRSWKPWAGVTQLYLHAGKDNDPMAWSFIRNNLGLDIPKPAELPRSQIIGHFTIAGLHEAHGCCDPWGKWTEYQASDHKTIWHWELADVKVLATAVPTGGRQGLWRIPPNEAAQLPEGRAA